MDTGQGSCRPPARSTGRSGNLESLRKKPEMNKAECPPVGAPSDHIIIQGLPHLVCSLKLEVLFLECNSRVVGNPGS